MHQIQMTLISLSFQEEKHFGNGTFGIISKTKIEKERDKENDYSSRENLMQFVHLKDKQKKIF